VPRDWLKVRKILIAPLVEPISFRLSSPCLLLDVDSTAIGANDPRILERAEAAESSGISMPGPKSEGNRGAKLPYFVLSRGLVKVVIFSRWDVKFLFEINGV
jgi:hypothetical protein